MLLDPQGRAVEGDRLVAALAPHQLSWGKLSRPAVVFTALANLGAERYLTERRFEVLRVPIGDRNVALTMEQEGVDSAANHRGTSCSAAIR